MEVHRPASLTPLIGLISAVLDEAWAIRIPAVLFAVASIFVVSLLAREVGGSRAAQAWTAWGYSFGMVTLLVGHVLLTASLDLVVWPAILLCVLRAQLRLDVGRCSRPASSPA